MASAGFFFDFNHVKDNNLCSKFTYVDKGKLLLIQPGTKKTKKGKLLISHMPRRPSYGKIVQDSQQHLSKRSDFCGLDQISQKIKVAVLFKIGKTNIYSILQLQGFPVHNSCFYVPRGRLFFHNLGSNFTDVMISKPKLVHTYYIVIFLEANLFQSPYYNHLDIISRWIYQIEIYIVSLPNTMLDQNLG